MMSPGQFEALKNLARKHAGEDVDWINIGDARALTDLGFAERSREGWTITTEGLKALADADEPPVPDEPPTPIR